MSTEIINISKQEGNNGLYLTDNEGHSGKDNITTKVHPGDTVTWKLVPNGGIDQITGITAKPDSQDIFSVDPAPVNPDDPQSDWSGTVSPDATGTELYNIAYKIGGNSFVDDPELELEDDG
jgi:phosphoribosylformylglycinamidine (FGAM) synthase-like amidotransferase family enzyme